MASLKDINASVQEGNEDLQRLNSNFASWLNMQKTSGDDLEAKAEKRTSKKKGGGITNIFRRDSKSKGTGLFGSAFGPKQLAVYTALIAPVLFDLFKKEIKDWLDSLNPFNNPAGPDKNRNIIPPGVALSYKQMAITLTKARNDAKLNKVARASFLQSGVKPPPIGTAPKFTFTTPRGEIPQRGPLKPGFVQDKTGKYVPLVTKSGKVNPNATMIINRATVVGSGGTGAGAFRPTVAPNLSSGAQSTTSRLTLGQSISAYAKGNALAGNRQMPTAKYFQGLMNFLGSTKLGAPVKLILKLIFSRIAQALLLPALTGFQIYLIWTQQKLDWQGLSIVPKLQSEMLSLEGQLVQTGAMIGGLIISRAGVIIGGAVGTFVLGAPVGTILGAAIGGYIVYKLGVKAIFFMYEFYKADDKKKFIKDFLTGKLADFQGDLAEFKSRFGKKNGSIMNDPKNINSFNQSIDYQVLATDLNRAVFAEKMDPFKAFNIKEKALTALENRFRNPETGGTTDFLQNERKKLSRNIPTTSSFGQMVPTSILPPELAAKIYNDNFNKNLQGSSTNSFITNGPDPILANALSSVISSDMAMNMGLGGGGVSLTDQSVRTDTKLTMAIGSNENFNTRNAEQNQPWMPLQNFRTA